MMTQPICNGDSGVCPDCFAQYLIIEGDRARCENCRGMWTPTARIPCPELIFGQIKNHHTGSESSWLCPSHMCLGYNNADVGDGPDRFLQSTPRGRAVHEAGHIVVARWFGFSIKSARVVPDPDDFHSASAKIDYGEPPVDLVARQDWAERIARVCYAGSMATALYYEGEATDKDSIDDFCFAAFTLAKHVEACRRRTRRNRLLEEAKTDTRTLLKKLEDASRKLADALAAVDRMNEVDIHSLIDPLIPSTGRPTAISSATAKSA